MAGLILILALCATALAQEQQRQQQPARPDADQLDDVIRVETNLIQAGVTVLDKQGRFVAGLKPEQFEVRVDGKPQVISFFDQVAAGSEEERAKLAAMARGATAATNTTAKPSNPKASGPLSGQGRVVLFFLDDLHMSVESLTRSRKVIQHFIDNEMGQNDVAVVASASGQLGFLQQLTDNKAVLRAAVSRLKPWPQATSDGQQPAMTEYIARAIEVDGDRDTMEVYIQALIREGARRPLAEGVVKERARAILNMANAATKNTLRALSRMVRSVSPVTGRKLVFFLSDGFLLSRNDSDTANVLHDITDAAVRAGFVFYTLDARGIAVDSWLDVSEPLPGDTAGIILRATTGEVTASQESLYLLAEQTGGRALLNTNALNRAVSRTVNETAAYYVVAWQPAEGEQKGGKFHRLEVSVKDRPDLIVLVQRGYLERGGGGSSATNAARGKEKDSKPDDELNKALAAAVPVRELPASLSLSYLSTQKDSAVMTALLSVPLDSLAHAPTGEVALEVRGYVVNLDGKIGSRFGERLSAKASPRGASSIREREQILYRHQVKLAPGIYQVRAAVKDANGRRVGSIAEWVEIPDLRPGKLTLGSILVGERPQETTAPVNAENFVSQRGADYSYARASDLRFMTYVYNAPRGAQNAQPDLEVQIRVSRDGKPVFTDDWRRVEVTGQDFERIAYGGEISLDTLSPGRYTLQLAVRDKATKIEATNSAIFFVE